MNVEHSDVRACTQGVYSCLVKRLLGSSIRKYLTQPSSVVHMQKYTEDYDQVHGKYPNSWESRACANRLLASRIVQLAAISYITGAAHTVIPIQRQHAHKIATSVTTVQISKEDASRFRKRRGRRDTIPGRVRRAAQSSQATKNCRGSETAEARERRDRDRTKRRLDSENAEMRLSSETLSK